MHTTKGLLIRIEAPHFVAGIVKEYGKPCRYAPILRWMAGMTNSAITDIAKRKGWKIEFYAFFS